jgi:hypothetical protein
VGERDNHLLSKREALLNEITKRFIDGGIFSNYLPFSDRSVYGSEFFGFRNDSGFDKKYIDGLNAQNFNPTDQEIPIEWHRLRITYIVSSNWAEVVSTH